jgi:hypothetical protein
VVVVVVDELVVVEGETGVAGGILDGRVVVTVVDVDEVAVVEVDEVVVVVDDVVVVVGAVPVSAETQPEGGVESPP